MIGFIEGDAEANAAITKVFSGVIQASVNFSMLRTPLSS
jgi:hypothetical protein